MVVNCDIKFDNNPHGIYFAGQTLSGTVELSIDKPKKVKGVCLRIEGIAKCGWKENESMTKNDVNGKENVYYEGVEEYLSSNTYLIGGEEGSQVEILPGIHTYNFRTVLPSMLPTSFEAKYGYIRYTVRVALERPWKFDLTYKVAFTVLKQQDLNYENPTLRIPTKLEETKTYCCGICRMQPLYVAATIPFSGYVAGQTVQVEIDINNHSRIDVEMLKVCLIKIIKYRSQTPKAMSKEENVVEKEINCGKINKHYCGKFKQNFVIPPLPPTNNNSSRLLTVAYEIHVVALMPNFFENVTLRLPIIIGTVPLMFSPTYPQTPNPTFLNPTFQSASPTANRTLPITEPISNSINQDEQRTIAAADLPPPTYEESLRMGGITIDEEGEHAMGHKPFNPRYPVYKFEASAGFRVLRDENQGEFSRSDERTSL